VSVEELPSQIVDGDAEADTEIEFPTNTVAEDVAEQPLRNPVTVYVVVTLGLTTILAVV
jgi:hypothetical protein